MIKYKTHQIPKRREFRLLQICRWRVSHLCRVSIIALALPVILLDIISNYHQLQIKHHEALNNLLCRGPCAGRLLVVFAPGIRICAEADDHEPEPNSDRPFVYLCSCQ